MGNFIFRVEDLYVSKEEMTIYDLSGRIYIEGNGISTSFYGCPGIIYLELKHRKSLGFKDEYNYSYLEAWGEEVLKINKRTDEAFDVQVEFEKSPQKNVLFSFSAKDLTGFMDFLREETLKFAKKNFEEEAYLQAIRDIKKF